MCSSELVKIFFGYSPPSSDIRTFSPNILNNEAKDIGHGDNDPNRFVTMATVHSLKNDMSINIDIINMPDAKLDAYDSVTI